AYTHPPRHFFLYHWCAVRRLGGRAPGRRTYVPALLVVLRVVGGPRVQKRIVGPQNSYIRRRSSSYGDPNSSSSQSHSHGHGHGHASSTTTPPRSRSTSTATPATTPTPTPTTTPTTTTSPSSGSVSVAPHRKTAKSPSPAFYSPVRQAPANHAKLSGGTHKKYVKVG
ncbi:unnamed protein product, partial [Ectocarpus sp. 8 AP-2014]